jgi:hypothetical protein
MFIRSHSLIVILIVGLVSAFHDVQWRTGKPPSGLWIDRASNMGTANAVNYERVVVIPLTHLHGGQSIVMERQRLVCPSGPGGNCHVVKMGRFLP